MSEYTKQADDFLVKNNLEFRAVLVGSDCPRFCEDSLAERDMDKTDTFPRKTHIHGKHYRCTISGEGRGHVAFDLWNSYADEEKNWVRKNWHAAQQIFVPKTFGRGSQTLAEQYRTHPLKDETPTAYDLLACIEKNDPGDFEEFCSEFGYDTDSRRAEDNWRAVVKEWQKVRRFFTAEELAELQEIS